MHYYQFNIADYRKDTQHLNPMEHYIYRELMDWYYLDEKPIPDKTQLVIRRLRLVSENKPELQNVLDEFFVLDGESWIHSRISTEINRYQKRVQTAQANGSKGGRPKKKEKTQSVNSANPKEPRAKLTNNHKPITIYKKITLDEVPEQVREVCKEFIDHRVNLKKPLTQKAFERFCSAASETANDLAMPFDLVVTTAIDAGWQSVKTEWVQNKLGAANEIRPGSNTKPDQPKLTPAQRTAAKREAVRQRELTERQPIVGSVGSTQ
jgi:uncharacterized protein YdaU (DUF1376 family)